MNDISRKAIQHYGETIQMFVAIEEMSELTKELTKHMRGEDNKEAMTEEIADVYIMIEQVMYMNEISLNDVVEKMHEKLNRLKERMDKESELV
jgi:NTP pyrophosphatase (non-canonical NTP hydrolase)